jgi:hypothetical protein
MADNNTNNKHWSWATNYTSSSKSQPLVSPNERVHTSANDVTSTLEPPTARYSILPFVVSDRSSQITNSKAMFRRTDSQVFDWVNFGLIN